MSRAAGIIPGEAVLSCSRCAFPNPPDAGSCGNCGATLEFTCAACGTSNPPRFRYCGGCGSPLEWPGPRPVQEASAPTLAERRQLTVMFCDLVGSTALSLNLDPEELRDRLRSYQAVCADAAERFDGYIAQYLGDGILVYFGYPRALENEAEHAVRAARRIIDEMARLNARLRLAPGTELSVRIGIHTGLVVIGEVGGGARRENLALGGTPNVAARLQALAEPNTVVISAVTQRLVSRHFLYEDLGVASLDGAPGIGSVYRVLGERPRPRAMHRTRLVGRTTELTILAEAWREASGGAGQTALVLGDAGIGKSHLVDEFLNGIESADHVSIECRCLPYYANTALHPFTAWIEREIGWHEGQSPEQTMLALDAMLERDGFEVAESLPIFAGLLQLPVDFGEESLAPQALKEMTRAHLIRLILKAAEHGPAVFLMEDLHWADASTLELLELLMPQLARAKMLTLLTSRPGFQAGWVDRYATRLDLGRLSQIDSERIILSVTGKPLPHEVMRHIVTKTDGVPLFVEELCKMVVQSGLLEEGVDRFMLTGPLPPLAIPETLQDSLEARLDQLVGVKEVAQLGASLGREFSYPLLSAVAGLDDAALQSALSQLVQADLIFEEGTPPASTYQFKHALIQDAAYESLLRSTRQRYHQRIALALERRFPETVETEPETLAHHWTAADLPNHAVTYWLKAGHRSLRASANIEAKAHLQRGLDLIPRLTDEDERVRLEIELQAALGTALLSTEGYTSPAAKRAFDRARELGRDAPEAERLAPILTGLFAYYLVRSDLRAALEVATEVDEMARDADSEELRLVADTLLGIVKVTQGDIRAGRVWLERVNATYDREKHSPLAMKYGHDMGVLALTYMAWLEWIVGFPLRSRATGEAAIALARSVRHPHSIAFALAFVGAQHRMRGEVDAAAAIAEDLLPLATQWRFTHWRADAVILQAWVLAERGQHAAAQERLDEGMLMLNVHEGWRNQFYSLMRAHVLVSMGRNEDALAAIEEGAGEELTALSIWTSEQSEWVGRILARQPGREEQAEAWIRQGLEEALKQGALMPALRAATTLGRLLESRGRGSEAARILTPIFEQFTEGHELHDLREAADLLARTRASRGSKAAQAGS